MVKHSVRKKISLKIGIILNNLLFKYMKYMIDIK